MRMVNIIFAIVFVAALAWLINAALPHEMAAAEGIPEYVYQSGCCGKGDCNEIPFENVTLTEEGYTFRAPPEAPNKEPLIVKDENNSSQLRDSADGKYWACFNRPGKACIEYSNSGGGSCIKFSPIPDPWEVRCFFRPVNM